MSGGVIEKATGDNNENIYVCIDPKIPKDDNGYYIPCR